MFVLPLKVISFPRFLLVNDYSIGTQQLLEAFFCPLTVLIQDLPCVGSIDRNNLQCNSQTVVWDFVCSLKRVPLLKVID